MLHESRLHPGKECARRAKIQQIEPSARPQDPVDLAETPDLASPVEMVKHERADHHVERFVGLGQLGRQTKPPLNVGVDLAGL